MTPTISSIAPSPVAIRINEATRDTTYFSFTRKKSKQKKANKFGFLQILIFPNNIALSLFPISGKKKQAKEGEQAGFWYILILGNNTLTVKN